MYIERNGYLVVNPEELSFLTKDRDFSDDLESADIFGSNISALEAIDQFIEGANRYIVVNYHQTIWLDRADEQPTKKCNTDICCSEEDYNNIVTALEEKPYC